MTGIEFITRFIAYFPSAGERGRDELVRVTGQVDATDLTVVRREPYLLAVASRSRLTPSDATQTLLDIFPGTASSERMATRNFDAAAPMEVIHQTAEASAQYYNLLRAARTDFVLESDMLGLKPVYSAQTSAGTVLASRIADVLDAFPALAQPADLTAIYELLGFWATLGQRTLYRHIQRTLPGGSYRWTPAGGLAEQQSRRLDPTPAKPYWFMDQAIASVRAASRDSVREKTAGAPASIWLALSGGFDSRFIAALCRDLHLPIRAVSHGHRHHQESHSTKEVARALGLDLTMLRQDHDATLLYLTDHLDAMEGTADCGSVSIMSLLGARAAIGNTLLHGFCGDLLSGGHIDTFSAADYTSRDAMANAIVGHWFPASAVNLRGLFTPAPDLDAVRQDVFDGLRSDCPPYQAYLLWYAENRNRRFVASHIALLGEHFDMVAPFYDRRLFALWFSIPPVGLAGQTTLRQLLARYYPALARIPHPEQPAPIIPNLRSQIARFYRSLPKRALSGCIGATRAKSQVLRRYRDDNIRSLSRLAAPQQQAYMLSRINALQPTLHDMFGVTLSPQYRDILSTNLQALRALFTVASYAERQSNRARAENERATSNPQ